MKRRTFLKMTGTAAALALAGPASALTRKEPNLLIIHTDEHNFRTLGCYRDTLSDDQAFVWGKDAIVETPNIDWLAKEGALCTKFYATSPVCTPSRAAFVSGQYPQNTPAATNGIPIDDKVVTFAEILKRQGYATGYAGKWHIDGQGKPQWGPKRQFGFSDNRYMFNRGHWKMLEDTPEGPRVKARNDKDAPTYSVEGADAKSFTTDFLADKTVDFLKAHKKESFCFMVSIPDPHGPNSVRAPYDTMYKGTKFETPRTFNKTAAQTPAWGPKQKKTFSGAYLEQYYGMVRCIDDNVGKILDTLRDNGLMDNTIVIFTSDHGDLCGEHARDNKGVPYEASAKVPFILRYPAKVKANKKIHQALGCVDFLPTIINFMGFKTAGKEEGRDASALFTGQAPKDWNDIAIMRLGSWLSAVTTRYKLVFSTSDDPWLYDLGKDPGELTNEFLNPKHRNLVRNLSGQLIAYCKKYTDPFGEQPRIKADLAWAATGVGPYTSSANSAPKAKTGNRKKNKAAKK